MRACGGMSLVVRSFGQRGCAGALFLSQVLSGVITCVVYPVLSSVMWSDSFSVIDFILSMV